MTCRRSQVRVLYRPPRVPRPKRSGDFFRGDGTGLEQHGHAAGGATNTPVGCLLVRGSQRLGMSIKKDAARPFGLGTFFVVDGTGLEQHVPNAAKAIKAPVQRRRPQPAAETGRSCWGRVLIFQSPAKGLRKNQLTQPVALISARFPTARNVYRDDCRFVVAVQDSNRDKQRQDIPMRAVSCLLLFLIEYGILGSVQQIGIEISYIQRDLITVIFYYQISLKPLKTLSLSQVSFPLLFPLYYIVP